MKLIGGYGSPYTRRIAITLRIYGLEYELEKVTPFAEGKARLREINPLGRIPLLMLDNGEHICESTLILDYIDTLVDENRRLTPASGPDRWSVLNYAAVASAAADKLVTTLYEYHFRPSDMVYKPWIKMCDEQVTDSFRWLNSKLNAQYFVGNKLTQADISTAVFWQFAIEKRHKFCARMNCTALDALSDRLSELGAFQETTPEGPLPDNLELGLKNGNDSQ